MKIDTAKASKNPAPAGNEKMPLIKYEPDSKYTCKLWLIAAIGFAICAVIYVLGIVFANSVLTGVSLSVFVLLCIVLFLMYRKVRAANRTLTEEEIDELVEKYKSDLIDTFNGYDLDYSAHDILAEADKYRRMLEAENNVNELSDNESIATIFKKMLRDSKDSRAKRKQEKKDDRARRREEKAYAKQMKKEKKT